MTLKLIIGVLLLAAPVGSAHAAAQVASGRPAFEVASVKINPSGDRRSSMDLQAPDRLTLTNLRLDTLISLAYQIPAFKISGGPEPILSARFDIAAKAEGPVSSDQKWQMVRTLLEERFKVRVRTDTREGTIYALVVARSDGRLGPDIRPSTIDCDALIEARSRGEIPQPPPPKPGERPTCGAIGGPALFRAGGMRLSQFAGTLGAMMRQTVVDHTGLAGRFDFDISFSLDGLVPSGRGQRAAPLGAPSAGGPERPPSIFTTLQERLGLKLDARRGPVETFVVENAEMPTPD
jgi:uncharacterized protein (TIGR03435 family)